MKVPYIILAGVVATMLASSAMAVTGPIMLTKGLGSVPPAPPPATINCTANLTIVPGGAGASTVVAASLSGGALGGALGVCSAVVPSALPWAVSAPVGGQVTISGVRFTTIAGFCGPTDVVANWNGVSPTITFVTTLMAPDCRIN